MRGSGIRDHLKRVPGLVTLARNARKLYRDWRTMYLLSRYPDGSYLKCEDVEVFCNFNDPTYAWYDSLASNLSIDQNVINALLRQSQGNVVLDIGAHNGFFTAYLARLVQANRITNAKIIALEPDRNHFHCLQKTVARCSQSNILLIQKALADTDGVLTLYRTQDPCLHTYFTQGAETVESTLAQSLDSLVSEYLAESDKIAFIKIDIDGAEPALFSGGPRTLSTHRPTILMEFAPAQLLRAGVDAKKFYIQLCDNFEVYWISYQRCTIEKVYQSDYKEIEVTVGNAISDLVLSSFNLDFSEVNLIHS